MSKQVSKLALVPYKKITSSEAIVVTDVASHRPRRRRRKKKGGKKSGSKMSFISAYAKCMNQPFSCRPGPLGLGTLVPTAVATAGIRGSFTTNADGSYAIVANPYRVRCANQSAYGSFVSVDTAGFSTPPTWGTRFDAADLSSLANSFDRLRVICGGLRVYSTAAETATRGASYAGLVAPSGADITNLSVPGGTSFNPGSANPTASTMSRYPNLQFSLETRLINAVWRPVQIKDFDFGPMYSGTFDVQNQGPVLMVIGAGLPASTTVYFDCIFHYEGYNSTVIGPSSTFGTSHTPMTPNVSAPALKAPSTVESLWSDVKPYLSGAVDFLSEIGPLALDLFNGSGFNLNVPRLMFGSPLKSPVPANQQQDEKDDQDSRQHPQAQYMRPTTNTFRSP